MNRKKRWTFSLIKEFLAHTHHTSTNKDNQIKKVYFFFRPFSRIRVQYFEWMIVMVMVAIEKMSEKFYYFFFAQLQKFFQSWNNSVHTHTHRHWVYVTSKFSFLLLFSFFFSLFHFKFIVEFFFHSYSVLRRLT